MYLVYKKEHAITMTHSAQRKHDFLVKTKENTKSKKIAPKKKVAFELLHHILGNISTRSFMAGDVDFFCQDIELRIYLDLFFTSFQIYPTNKKSRYENLLKSKTTLK